MILVPLLLLVIVETGLRLAGYGYDPSFLLPAESGSREVWIQNDRFGWRFFGRRLAREPHAISLDRDKEPGVIRIFVFGESAAFGDPQPQFGLPRMLEAMLSLRYPETRFEVVNVAMTGINSHAVRSIARDCAGADGDIWVIYMGNNEVVGPFGAGTVFGQQTPPLALIRTSMALQTTRLGQLVDNLKNRLQPPAAARDEWGGMRMFLEHPVRADDPRMDRVYDHFTRNLSDIVSTGRKAGAGVVVSTVAVNLKDCPPFLSEPPAGWDEAQKARWMSLYAEGARLQDSGQHQEALLAFDRAGQVDNTLAELHWRRGWCLLALDDVTQARRSFVLARDLDSLRFRSDSRLSGITRQIVSDRNDEPVLLADAEAAFAVASVNFLPGGNLFYEHVHLRWEGNWLLARTIAEQVTQLLPSSITDFTGTGQAWPSLDECARRLGWTHPSQRSGLEMMLRRVQDPPFTYQLNHAQQVAHLRGQAEQLLPATQPAGLADARSVTEEAAQAFPQDFYLQVLLVELRQQTGDTNGAVSAAQQLTELRPHWAMAWFHLGIALVRADRIPEAIDAFQAGLRVDPDSVWLLNNLGLAYVRVGEDDKALHAFERAIGIKPRFGIAHLSIGQILERRGNTEEADEHYQKALANRIHRAGEMAALARFCATKGWHEAAVTNYLDAIKLSAGDPSLHIELAKALQALERHEEAWESLATAVRLAPLAMEPRFHLGLELGRQGKPAEAEEQFRKVVQLDPDLVEGHLNLAIALARQGSNQEALVEFKEVLRRSPTNTVALEYVSKLTGDTNTMAP